MKINDIQVFYSPRLAYSPAFKFIINGFADLVNAGHTLDKLGFENKSQVVYAADNGVILGASLFTVSDDKETTILFSYVDNEHRRLGIYKKLFENIEMHSRLQGALTIISYAWHNNDPIQRAVSVLDRELTSLRYEKRLS